MKKTISVLLALMLLFSLFAGCGEGILKATATEDDSASDDVEAPELAKGWYVLLDDDDEAAGYLHSTGRKLTAYDENGEEIMEETRFSWDEDAEAFVIDDAEAFSLDVGKKTTTLSVPKKSPLGIDRGDYTLEEIEEEDLPTQKAARTEEETDSDGYRTIYSYDENDSLIRIDVYDPNDNLCCWGTLEYDENGNKTLITGENTDENYDNCCSITGEYAYDSDGNVIYRSEKTTCFDGSWYTETESWTYDAGVLIKESSSDTDSDGTVYSSTKEYTYSGNLLVAETDTDADTWTYSDGSVEQCNSTTERTYTYQDGILIRERYAYNSADYVDGVLKDVDTYVYVAEYDSNGNVFRRTDYNGDGSLEKITEYTYDADGNVTVASIYDTDGNLCQDNHYSYTYDDTYDYYYESSWEEAYYEYNEDGNLNCRYGWTYDRDYNQIAYSQVYYEYDENGNLYNWNTLDMDEVGNNEATNAYLLYTEGNVMASIVEEYRNSLLTSWTLYGPNDQVVHNNTFTYTDDGQILSGVTGNPVSYPYYEWSYDADAVEFTINCVYDDGNALTVLYDIYANSVSERVLDGSDNGISYYYQ